MPALAPSQIGRRERKSGRSNLCRILYSIPMSIYSRDPTTVSVTEAAARGVASLVRAAEEGAEILVARRGHPVAAVVGMSRLQRLGELESDLRDISLVIARMATDSGERVELDQVIAAFGFNRAELAAELEADLAAGRD